MLNNTLELYFINEATKQVASERQRFFDFVQDYYQYTEDGWGSELNSKFIAIWNDIAPKLKEAKYNRLVKRAAQTLLEASREE